MKYREIDSFGKLYKKSHNMETLLKHATKSPRNLLFSFLLVFIIGVWIGKRNQKNKVLSLNTPTKEPNNLETGTKEATIENEQNVKSDNEE